MAKMKLEFYGAVKPNNPEKLILQTIAEAFGCKGNVDKLFDHDDLKKNKALIAWLKDNNMEWLLSNEGQGNIDPKARVAQSQSAAQIRKNLPHEMIAQDGRLSEYSRAELINAILVLFGRSPTSFIVESGLMDALHPETSRKLGGFESTLAQKKVRDIAKKLADEAKVIISADYLGDVFYGRSTELAENPSANFDPDTLIPKWRDFMDKAKDLFVESKDLLALAGGTVPRPIDFFKAVTDEASNYKDGLEKEKRKKPLYPWQVVFYKKARVAKIFPPLDSGGEAKDGTIATAKDWFKTTREFMMGDTLVSYGGKTRNLGGPARQNYYEGSIELDIPRSMAADVLRLLREGRPSARFLHQGNISVQRLPENEDDFDNA